MGKKKKKTDADKLPKKIAGVKVPKELRKAGDQLVRIVKDPLAREIALGALAAALAARKDARKAALKTAQATGGAAENATGDINWLGAALGAAALEAGRTLIEAFDDKRPTTDGNGSLEATRDAVQALAGGLKH